MKSIFFSYSRHDSDFALKLGKDLRAAGIGIWLDQLDIEPGERWDVAVEHGLAESSRMLVILSPASVASTNVMDEVSYALEENKPVIPVLHGDCEIPFRLRRVQYTDFRTDYQAAFDSLLKYLNAAAAPVAGPPRARGAAHAVPSASDEAAGHSPAGGVQARPPAPANGRSRLLIFAAPVLVLAGLLGFWLLRGKAPSTASTSSAVQGSAHQASPASALRDTVAAAPAAAATAAPTPAAPAPPATAEAPTQAVGRPRVRIVNANSRLCLTPAGGSQDRNVPMVQYLCDDDPSRFWSIGPENDVGLVAIKNLNSDLCLTIAGGNTERNITAVQYDCDGDPSRLWKLRRVDGEIVQLVNTHSALCLTIAGGGTERNMEAVQYACDGDPSRDWQIRDAPGPVGP